MDSPRKKQKIIDSHTPSEALQEQARQLLIKYPLPVMEERLQILSRNMRRDGEVNEENSRHRLTDEAVEGRQVQTAANDLNDVYQLIKDVSKGKPLERNPFTEQGNAHLMLFESHHPRLPPRISKCMNATMTWCAMQMDELESQASEMASNASRSDPEVAKLLSKQLRYLDETSGMVHQISQLAEAARLEVEQSRQSGKSGGRVA